MLQYTTCKIIMQINLKYIHFNDFKDNGWHCGLSFLFTYRVWLKEETWVIPNYIRDIIKYLKKEFSIERGICLVTWYLLMQIPRYTEFPRTNTPAMVKNREKKLRNGKKYLFYQPIRRQHSYIRWNYRRNMYYIIVVTVGKMSNNNHHWII